MHYGLGSAVYCLHSVDSRLYSLLPTSPTLYILCAVPHTFSLSPSLSPSLSLCVCVSPIPSPPSLHFLPLHSPTMLAAAPPSFPSAATDLPPPRSAPISCPLYEGRVVRCAPSPPAGASVSAPALARRLSGGSGAGNPRIAICASCSVVSDRRLHLGVSRVYICVPGVLSGYCSAVFALFVLLLTQLCSVQPRLLHC